MAEQVIWSCPCGQVKGQKLQNAFLFRGLPYAETERFQSPVLIRHWEGVHDGTADETDCWQRSCFEDESGTFYGREFRAGRSFRYAESPMTLNVVSPSSEGRRPVLLFFHGGAFETGTVGELPYGTSTEYAKRGIVLVSAGYRLNAFGLYGGSNFGLQDQLSAVDWVRDNIVAFGGDPEQITVMGQSAGAMSVMDMLCSGKLSGKIRHAVMISGAGIVPGFVSPLPREKTEAFWKKVDAAAGGDAGAADPETLWRAWRQVKSREKMLKGMRLMQPCLDGTVLREPQAKTVRSGRLQNIPLMVSVTSQDYMPYFIFEMALQLGRLCSRKGHAPVYGYFFDRELPGNSYRAFHASDLWYLFGNMDQSWRPFEERDYRLSAAMIDAVAAFCRTGTPGDPKWLPLSDRQKGFRLFDGVSDGMTNPGYCRKKMRETIFRNPGPA